MHVIYHKPKAPYPPTAEVKSRSNFCKRTPKGIQMESLFRLACYSPCSFALVKNNTPRARVTSPCRGASQRFESLRSSKDSNVVNGSITIVMTTKNKYTTESE